MGISVESTEWLFSPLFPVRIGIWKCWFLRREENGSTRRKTLRAGTRTNNKLNPHMTPSPGIEPGPHWWEASALTTAPCLLPFEHEKCASFFSIKNNFVKFLIRLVIHCDPGVLHRRFHIVKPGKIKSNPHFSELQRLSLTAAFSRPCVWRVCEVETKTVKGRQNFQTHASQFIEQKHRW